MVELMITMVILSISSGIVLLTFRSAFDARDAAMSRLDVAEKTRSVLQVISDDLSSAYINDLGLRPNSWEGEGPDVRTGGWPPDEDPYSINREVIGDGEDNDGDNLADEVQLRFTGRMGWRYDDELQWGVDNDNDGELGEDGAYFLDRYGRYIDDVGIDSDGDGLVDEDGIYPADTLNFAVTQSGADRGYDVAEVGYCVGTRLYDYSRGELIGNFQTRLLRRAVVRYKGGPYSLIPVDGQFLNEIGNKRGRDADETEFTTLFYDIEQRGRSSENEIDVLGFDVVGLELRYWYYNYAIAQELSQYPVPGNVESGRDMEFAGMDIDNDGDGSYGEDWPDGYDNDGDGRIDEDPYVGDFAGLAKGPWRWVRGNWESSVERYPNEPQDVGTYDTTSETADEQQKAVREKAIEHMDGLPEMVWVRIFVYDSERNDLSVKNSTIRVRIPAR